MKRFFNWQVVLGLGLVALSALVYLLHYAIFHDAHHILIYFVGDVAFVPIEVLLVTLIIHRLLSVREKRALRIKLNMVIGAFFSELGTDLINIFLKATRNPEEITKGLRISTGWKKGDFQKARELAAGFEPDMDMKDGCLREFKEFLKGNKMFLLRLLENPNLIEHDSFTDLLWAVFHLLDELEARDTLEGLPESDYEHLKGDTSRAYECLLREWLTYMEHLKEAYPYLFSLAVRTNPLDPEADSVVRS